MPVARLSFPSYQSSNENGGGGHAWSNVQGAGATAEGAGAYNVRDPNSADMNWLRSYGDGARGSATIPDGATINGIIIGFQAHQYNGNQVGGTYEVQIFKAGSPVGTAKSGSIAQGGSIGPFGGTTDKWGLGTPAPSYFTNMYFGLHLNFPSITSDITMYAWNGYMDIYYTDAVSAPASISIGAGNNQSAQVSTQYGLQLYAIVRDQAGNPKSGVSVTFTMPASGATARFNSVGGSATAVATTNSSGGALSPFFFANATAGSFLATADVTGSSPLIFVQFNLTNTPVPPTLVPTTISKLQGDGQQASVLNTFAVIQKVKVWDQFVHVMPNVEINWTLPSSGARGNYAGSGVGVTVKSFTDSSGIATAPALTANSVSGAWVENAFPTGFAGVNASFGFTNLPDNSPPTATLLQLVQGENQKVALSGTFANAFQVKVLDQYGSPFYGANVTLTIPSAAYGYFGNTGNQTQTQVSGEPIASGTPGVARFGVVVASGTAQSNWAITATCPGCSPLNLTGLYNVDATIVTAISVVAGSQQKTPPSSAFTTALVARATNGLGNPVQNFAITFTAPGSAASCRFTGSLTQVVNTAATGNATSVFPTATATEGTYNVVASGAGVTSVNFILQNGNDYTAETCTSLENFPGPNSNVSNGSVGGTATNWGSLSSASSAAQGGGGSTNQQDYVASVRTMGLFLGPPPASWAAIPDDAVITSILLNYSAICATVSTQVGTGLMYTGMLKGGASYSSSQSGSSMVVDVFQQTSRTVTPTLAQPMSGAEAKLSNTGFYINFQPSSNFGGSQQCRVNGCQTRICWKMIIPPPQRIQVPLMWGADDA